MSDCKGDGTCNGHTRDDAISELAIDAQIEYDAAERVINLLANSLFTPYAHYLSDVHLELARVLTLERLEKFEEERNAKDQGDD